jgi:2-succinyl-6-hydroxy-2,4-cyclohexadiene-1-carboxylate synthase
MDLAMLHGFLGQPDDWRFLGPALARDGIAARVEMPDLWAEAGRTFDDLVDHLARRFENVDVLGGYSMGGRLALAAFLHPASRARALVMVSSDPGGPSPKAREARRVWDDDWAERFMTEAWSSLIPAWNALPVFRTSSSGAAPARSEEDFDRRALAHALRHWSVACQPDLRGGLRDDERPVLCLAGESDEKYAAIARDLGKQGERIDVHVLAAAGHRLLGETPDQVSGIVAGFLRDRVPPTPVRR